MFINERESEDVTSGSKRWWKQVREPRLQVVGGIAALAVGTVVYKMVHGSPFGGSGLMFLGIPSVLAILLVLLGKPKSATGSILMGIAVAVLAVAPLLGEGFLCILMASPLFFLVGLVVGLMVDRVRARRRTRLGCLALVLLPMSLEGVVPWLTVERGQTVVVTRVVEAPAAEVERALRQSPRVSEGLPGFLRVGFPRPLEAHGEGLGVGDERVIHFAGVEGAPAGDLVMRVTESGPGRVRFEAVSDGSKLRHWMQWRASEVRWESVGDGRTRVSWEVRFDRELDPYWYFAPMERLAVREAAGYLIAVNATPGSAAR